MFVSISDHTVGDVALTSESYLPHLIRGGSLRLAWREAIGEELLSEGGWTRWSSLKASATRAFVPNWLRWLRRRLSPDAIACLSPTFAKSVRAIERLDRYWRLNGDQGRNLVEDRCRAMMAVNPVVGRERYDRVAASCAIECRDPFMDRRVLEFLLRVPGPLLQRDGWRKLILRRALRGLLPEQIVRRRGKEHVGWQFAEKLAQRFPRFLCLDPKEIVMIEPYVADMGPLSAGQPVAEADRTWFSFQAISLARWLAQRCSGER